MGKDGRHHERPEPGRRRRRGFTIGEMLLALTIMALLLTAVGTAMKGTLMAYAENGRIAEVTQCARVVLNKMTTELRTAEAVESTPQCLSIIPPTNPDNITLIKYELVGGVLYYRYTVGGLENSIPLIASDEVVKVDSLVVSRQTAQDGEGVTYTVSVTARLNLKAGSNPLYMTASVCPRRNMQY